MAKLRIAKFVYLIVAWIPSALLLFMYVAHDYLKRMISDSVIVLGLLMALLSLVLGLLGVVLVLGARSRQESSVAYMISTVIAFVPLLIYLKLLVVQL